MTTPPPRRAFRLSSWAVANPLPVVLLFVALTVAGLVAFATLPVKRYPDIAFPAVSVTVVQPGTAAGEMETTVTRPIEQAVAGLPRTEIVVSTIAQGVSTTVVQFDLGQDLREATDKIRTQVEQVRTQLPAGIDPPVVRQVEIEDIPILSYAVTSSRRSIGALSTLIDDDVAAAIQRVPGVSKVTRIGGVAREINVIADPARMAALGLTVPQLNEALRRFSRDDPAGLAQIGGREQAMRLANAAVGVEDLRAMTIPAGNGRTVRLGDVAEVGDGVAETRSFARLNGAPAIGFQIARTRAASELAVEDGVDKAVAALAAAHPDLRVRRLFSTVDETRASYDATLKALLEGLVLTSLAVWLFLRDWRATAIAAIAMPASLIPTFAAMALLGFSLNVVTLLALTLVIGILVDDAIVEIENIEKRLQTGMPPRAAAIDGANAIGLAVVATTLAIVVVFLPVSFMAGVPGRFFHEFGIAVSIAVLFSLAVARLLTPLMAARFLHAGRSHAAPPRSLFYARILDRALAAPWWTVLACGAMLVATAGIVPLLSTGFQPAGDPDHIYVKVQGTPGATAVDMDRAVAAATALFRNEPEVATVFAQVGSKIGGGAGGDRGLADLRDATLTIVFRPDRTTSATAFRDRLRPRLRTLADARINFLGDTAGPDIVTVLTGDDPILLQATANRLLAEMKCLPAIDDPRLSAPPGAPEIVIRPDRAAMARLGISADTLATIARVATMGDIDRNLARLADGEDQVNIRLRLPETDRQDLDQLRNLRIPTGTGGTTTLGAVATLDFAAALPKITRMDQRRQIAIESDLSPGVEFGDATAAIRALPAMRSLPAGIDTAALGNQRAMEQLFTSLALVFLTAVGLLYLLLVLLLGNLSRPVVILCALPPALTGAFLALLLGGFALNLPSLIGILMLIGLAAKNSILIVDHAMQCERDGDAPRRAIVAACHERARPIVMTSVAMAAGMIPTALALGQGAEFRQPMAICVIGGLATSTLVSLVIVPVVYLLVARGRQRRAPRTA